MIIENVGDQKTVFFLIKEYIPRCLTVGFVAKKFLTVFLKLFRGIFNNRGVDITDNKIIYFVAIILTVRFEAKIVLCI